MTQPNDTSSPMPAKNQTLFETEVLQKHIGTFPYDPPPEVYRWVANGWKIENIEHQIQATLSKRFDELFSDKIEGLINKKKDRSQRCDLRAIIILQLKYLTEFQGKRNSLRLRTRKLKPPPEKKIKNLNKKNQ